MPDRQRTREDEAGHCPRATPPPRVGAIASRETVDGLRLIHQKRSGAGPVERGPALKVEDQGASPAPGSGFGDPSRAGQL
jgi:hypothetical protein